MKNITKYDLFVGASRDHRLDHIYTSKSFVKVKGHYANPERKSRYGAADLSLVELAEPFELGKNNLYPSCLLDFYVEKFDKFLFAGYGMTKTVELDLKKQNSSKLESRNAVQEEDNSLLMIDKLERIKCDEKLICARSLKSTAVCHLDQGGGLLHAFYGKLYVTGLLADSNLTCSPGSVAKYSPVYENLDWIDDYVQLDRCFTPIPLVNQTEILVLILISMCCFLAALIVYLMRPCLIRKDAAAINRIAADNLP